MGWESLCALAHESATEYGPRRDRYMPVYSRARAVRTFAGMCSDVFVMQGNVEWLPLRVHSSGKLS